LRNGEFWCAWISAKLLPLYRSLVRVHARKQRMSRVADAFLGFSTRGAGDNQKDCWRFVRPELGSRRYCEWFLLH